MIEKKKYTIKELRQLCQDTGPAKMTQTITGLTARFFSIYVTKFLVKTKITPNQITFFGVFVYLIGSGFYAFDNYILGLIGFTLLIFETILDACDGEVFRFRKYRQGYGGSYVEPVSHDIKYGFMFIPIAYGAFLYTGNPLMLLFGAGASIFKLLFRISTIRFFYGVTKKLEEKGNIDRAPVFDKTPGWRRVVYILYRQTATSTGLLLPLLIATLFMRLDLFIVAYGIFYFLLWVALIVRQLNRFRKISKQVIDRHNYFEKAGARFKNKKIIVFDLDGTLLDTMGIFADIASYLMSWKHRISRSEARKMYIRTSGIPFFRQLEVLFEGNSSNKEIAELFEERKVIATDHLEIDLDEKKVVEKLGKERYRLAISSNNFQENVDRFAKTSDIPFTHVLGFREGFSKGQDHFRYIFKKENCTSKDVLFIGDSLSDMEKAQACGIDFVAKTGTFSKEDFEGRCSEVITIRHLGELYDILE